MNKVKTKLKPLIILIAIFIVTLSAGLVTACTIGEPDDKERADALGMTNCVTYYANGGIFSGSSLCYMSFYFKDGTPIFNIGEDAAANNQRLSISRTGYVFMGWRYCALDENGDPLLVNTDPQSADYGKPVSVRENGTANIVGADGKEMPETDKKFEGIVDYDRPEVFANGNHPVISGDAHWYVVATWELDILVEYKLVSESPVEEFIPDTFDEEDGNESEGEKEEVKPQIFNPGETIYTQGFGKQVYRTLSPKNFAPDWITRTHSYIHLYYDAECTQPVVQGEQINKYPDSETGEYNDKAETDEESGNRILYAKYIEGNWTPVRESADVDTMLDAYGTTGFYVLNDIVYTGTRKSNRTSTYNGVIEGNGYTISNLTAEYSNVRNGNYSIFGNLGESAKINNLTLANVTFNISVNDTASSVAVYALFLSVGSGAEFTDFNVEGIALNITVNGYKLSNITGDNGEYNVPDQWLYSSSCTDEEFVANYPGINVQKATLTINDQTII